MSCQQILECAVMSYHLDMIPPPRHDTYDWQKHVAIKALFVGILFQLFNKNPNLFNRLVQVRNHEYYKKEDIGVMSYHLDMIPPTG